MTTMGRFDDGRASVVKAVTSHGSPVDVATLRALHDGDPVPSTVLAEWAARVRMDATQVEDLHLQALRGAGMDDAAVVAATTAIAVGEASRRLAAVQALRQKRKETKR
jgi:alkylhydroperoxidase family enzyme